MTKERLEQGSFFDEVSYFDFAKGYAVSDTKAVTTAFLWGVANRVRSALSAD